jgi:hypothetical protein
LFPFIVSVFQANLEVRLNLTFAATMKLLYSLLTLLPGVLALGQDSVVTLKSAAGLLQLAGGGLDGQILVSANDWWGVIRAAEDLASDIGKVTGKNMTLGGWQKSTTASASSAVTYEYREPLNNINVSCNK